MKFYTYAYTNTDAYARSYPNTNTSAAADYNGDLYFGDAGGASARR